MLNLASYNTSGCRCYVNPMLWPDLGMMDPPIAEIELRSLEAILSTLHTHATQSLYKINVCCPTWPGPGYKQACRNTLA